MTNNRLQMLIRLLLSSTINSKSPGEDVDELVAKLSSNLCASEFIYDAMSELRRDGQVDITGVSGVKKIHLTEMGKRVLDFDNAIVDKMIELDIVGK